MKNLFADRKFRTKALTCLAVASVPLTALAYLVEDYGLIDHTLIVGSSYIYTYSGYSYEGLLMVGSNLYLASNTTTIHNAMVVGDSAILYDSGSVVIGSWNEDTGGDELLVAGNGTYGTPQNALELFKDGNMNVYGAITCSAGGDIPMYDE